MRIPALFHLIPIKRDKKPPPLVDGPADLLQGEFRGQGRRFLLLCGLFIGGLPHIICAAFLDGDRSLEAGNCDGAAGPGFPGIRGICRILFQYTGIRREIQGGKGFTIPRRAPCPQGRIVLN